MAVKLGVVVVVTLLISMMLRAAGPAVLFPFLPVLPLALIGVTRYRAHREEERLMRCPKCDLRLAYRRLGPSHGMLECPALCGFRRFVGRPGPRP
jgi:hypothetical protein